MVSKKFHNMVIFKQRPKERMKASHTDIEWKNIAGRMKGRGKI